MPIELKNTIILDKEEDYEKVGNSRIGGKPDLPRGMNYPIFENGFYEFILQINLKDNPIQELTNKGLLSIFYGNLDNNEATGYYFEDISELEIKEIPKDEKFAGVTDFVEHIPYKIRVESKKITPREDLSEYNDEQFTEDDNIMHWKMDFLSENSFLMDEGIEDKSSLYLKSNGFDRLVYGFGIRIDKFTNTIVYHGRNANKVYNSIEDIINCELTVSYESQRYQNKSNKEKWIKQLKEFEENKEYHLKKFKEFKCLLSLASLFETRMTWGDMHKLEIYGYKSDFDKMKFDTLNSTMA
ncbi:MAG: DUF1963 domain-containing protein [Bacteroidales bacterium]|nr:DUF1963 domain-containing protein [Bacteroidales bacterium]